MDNLVLEPSIATCQVGNHVSSKNLDSKMNLIDKSIEMRTNDTILENSSKFWVNNNDTYRDFTN